MTLPLETSQIRDDWARRAIEQIALAFPLAPQLLATAAVSASSGTLAPSAVTSTTYATFTGAASITIPVDGDYLVTVSGTGDAAAPDGTGILMLSYSKNGGAAVDATAIKWRSVNFQSNSRTFKVVGLKKGDVLAQQASTNTGTGRLFEADITAIRL